MVAINPSAFLDIRASRDSRRCDPGQTNFWIAEKSIFEPAEAFRRTRRLEFCRSQNEDSQPCLLSSEADAFLASRRLEDLLSSRSATLIAVTTNIGSGAITLKITTHTIIRIAKANIDLRNPRVFLFAKVNIFRLLGCESKWRLLTLAF
jgi:hypothetical protein